MNKVELSCRIAGIELKNPVITSSGTFGFGKDYSQFYDVDRLGAITTKGLTINEKLGNEGRRVYEVEGGLINSIGLQNPGIDTFMEKYEEYCGGINTKIIANLGGNTLEQYIEGAVRLSESKVDLIELNISCPNVKEGGMAFGIKSADAFKVVKEVKAVCKKPMIVKLSPNAENIVDMAQACEKAGADALSLVNTFKAMGIDIYNRKAIFKNVYAGLSGVAIKPIALRMVHEVCKNVNIPTIGMGGICSWEDAIEFIMTGAEAISVGSASFYNPCAPIDILEGIQKFMIEQNIKSLDEIRGII